jgi:hypothetical protein
MDTPPVPDGSERSSPPRVNVEIPPKLNDRLQELLPHGTKKPVVVRLLHDLCDLLEGEDADMVLGAILSNRLSYEYFSQVKVKKDGRD